MARLPDVGGDNNNWGTVLNDFLLTAHDSTGVIKSASIGDAQITDVDQSKVTGLSTSLAGKAASSRIITAGTGLTGGGDLTGDRTLTVTFGNVTAQTTAGASSSNGIATTVSRSDHTHGTPAAGGGGVVNMSPFGLQIETIHMYDVITEQTLAAGNMYAVLVRPGPVTISSLGLWCLSTAATANGVNAMALYSSDGQTLIDQTGDMSTGFTGTGYISGTLSSSHTLSADTSYYLAVLTHFASTPKIGCSQIMVAVPPVINNEYLSVVVSSLTSFPTSFTPSTAAKNNGVYWFAAS